MRLIFIHGWAFDASFWDALTTSLPDIPHVTIDLGFFGAPTAPVSFRPDDILVGHSLGFVWGWQENPHWRRWVAINSFTRFTEDEKGKGCVPPGQLRVMRRSLSKDASGTVRQFQHSIGAAENTQNIEVAKLDEGLEILEKADIGARLSRDGNQGAILASANDILVPGAATENMALQCRAVDLLWHATGGHMLPQKDPAWCAKQIRKFIGA